MGLPGDGVQWAWTGAQMVLKLGGQSGIAGQDCNGAGLGV